MRYRRSKPISPVLPSIIVIGILFGLGFFWRQSLITAASHVGLQKFLPLALISHDKASNQAGSISASNSGSVQPVALTGNVEIAPDGFPVQPRKHVLKYTVQKGDTLFGIAQKFNLDPSTIFWANTSTLKDNINLLFVGVQLYILPVDGVYYLADGKQSIADIAALYNVTPGDILYSDYNRLSQEDSTFIPPAGLHIVVPGGKRQYISWQAPIHTGTQSGSANPEGTIHPGSCRAHYTGEGGQGQYVNPVGDIAYRVTNGFALWHPGVDLAAAYGTPIHASETGVVVFAGWHRDGYGELIILDHGDGWTTYYGHLSKRYVGCGDQVNKDQVIGEMGMSGNATGVHLHFEVRDADVPQNPYDIITIHDERNSP